MTPTEQYTLLHQAFTAVGRAEKIAPHDARVLLAIHDLGGRVETDKLEAALGHHASAVRRSLGTLYDRGLAVGVASLGGRRRPGVRTLVSITFAGLQTVEDIRIAARITDASQAAA